MEKLNIAAAIKAARERRGMNQSELAREIGVAPQSVQLWETGATAPNRKRLALVAKVLGISVAELLHGLPSTEEPLIATPSPSPFAPDGELVEWCYTTLEGALSPAYLSDKASIPKRAQAVRLMYETLKEEKGDLEAAKERMKKWLAVMFA